MYIYTHIIYFSVLLGFKTDNKYTADFEFEFRNLFLK